MGLGGGGVMKDMDLPWNQKVALGLGSIGSALQGGDSMAPIKARRDELERDQRKSTIAEQLASMGMSGAKRAVLETLPLEQQQAYLMQQFEQQAAAGRAASAAALKQQELDAQNAAFGGYLQGQAPQAIPSGPSDTQAPLSFGGAAPQTAPLGASPARPDVPFAQAPMSAPQAATAVPDLSFGQPQQAMTAGRPSMGITDEMYQRALVDPRLSKDGLAKIKALYEFQNQEAPERKIVDGADGFKYYTDTGERVLPNVAAPQSEQWRTATPEEAAANGFAYGQVNNKTGKFAGTNGPSNGMTTTLPDGTVIQLGGTGGTSEIPKLTVDAAKNSGYLIRTKDANKVLNELEGQGTRFAQQNLGSVPLGLGNYFRDSEFQKYDQARRDFVNAILRRESGAVISDSEFENANQQYFPVPGDQPEVIAQKKKNRENAIEGLRVGSGDGAAYVDSIRKIPAVPEGITPENWPTLWDNMPEEDRALFK